MLNKPIRKLLAVLLLIWGCESDPLKDVDLNGVERPDIELLRLEQDIFSLNSDSIQQQTPALQKKYGLFYLHYIKGFINDGGIQDSGYAYNLSKFIQDRDMKEAYSDCEKVFDNVSDIESEIENAFWYYKYYFPDSSLPKVLTMFTGFNYSVAYVESTIGIGLEMYLGTNNRFYDMLSAELFPMYRRRNMNPQNVVPDAIKAWLTEVYPKNEEEEDFLSEIVHEGKLLYLMDALLPNTEDTLKIHYTGEGLEWCLRNEQNMWSFFIENNMVYSTELAEIRKFTSVGPFTSAFNKEAPDRVGHWIGWRIVRSFMEHNENVKVSELFSMDAKSILNRSNYKP